MTVMPDHAARLPETATLLVLDPVRGPVSRTISALALGDEVLVVAGSRMCFRRVMAAEEAPAPSRLTCVAPGAIGPDMPKQSVALDVRQPIAAPLSNALLRPAEDYPQPPGTVDPSYWLDITVENAERIIVDNMSIGTGPVQEMRQQPPVSRDNDSRSLTNVPVHLTALHNRAQSPGSMILNPIRAFNGTSELPLSTTFSEGPLTAYCFKLPPRTTTFRLSTASVQPPGDSRKLGIAIFRILFDKTEISLDSPALVRGFHRAESHELLAWRWTDGDGLLLLPPKPAQQLITIYVNDWHLTLQTASESNR